MLEAYLCLEGRMPGACSFEFTDRDEAVNRADKEYLCAHLPPQPPMTGRPSLTLRMMP